MSDRARDMEYKQLRALCHEAANLLEAKSDRSQRLEWARRLREQIVAIEGN